VISVGHLRVLGLALTNANNGLVGTQPNDQSLLRQPPTRPTSRSPRIP